MGTQYSKTPLYKKLGYKPGQKIYLKNPPEEYYEWVSPVIDQVNLVNRLTNDFDLIHFFTTSRKELEDLLPKYQSRIQENGMIWVSWPKKSSKVVSDVTENTIRKVCLPLGLVDVKVCSISNVWSGLKLVIRKELRDKTIYKLRYIQST